MGDSLILQHNIDKAIDLVGNLPKLHPDESLSPQLNHLFEELASTTPSRPIEEIEDDIWDCWMANPDEDLVDRLQHAVAAIGQQAWNDATVVINNLLRDCPSWAEAWNKRASLLHLIGQDAQSVSDICHTLQLEPRHFGALTALGKICLRHDQPQTAVIAFESALDVNPHLNQIRTTTTSLRKEIRHQLN